MILPSKDPIVLTLSLRSPSPGTTFPTVFSVELNKVGFDSKNDEYDERERAAITGRARRMKVWAASMIDRSQIVNVTLEDEVIEDP